MTDNQRANVIYFAGSIRGGRGDRELYAEIIGLLRKHGRVLTEHIADASLTEQGEALSDADIHERDIQWLRSATCVVAEVTTPSLGVGYEVGRAVEQKIPVMAIFRADDTRKISAMIAGCSDVRLFQYRDSADLPRIFDEFFLA